MSQHRRKWTLGCEAARGLLAVLLAMGMGSGRLTPDEARADEVTFDLKGGERIVFFGDSITQAGGFIADVEVFLLTRFPGKSFTIFNHGISSETISGTSEADHHPRRPDAHRRFSHDVAAWKPDVVVACFGMNDGNYHPFEPDRFARYQEGIHRLIDRTRDETGARLVLVTPPPFDPYRRSATDPNAVEYGYKFPAIDYDQTLQQYSRWLLTIGGQEKGLTVVDVHGALDGHLKRRRDHQVSFFLARDAVHPGPTGHWLMAQAILLAWHAPAEVAEARIDAAPKDPRVVAGAIRDLVRHGDGSLSFVWHSRLPMPIDPAWDRRSIELERVAERLNVDRLVVTGLPAARYRLLARLGDEPAEIEAGAFPRDQLERGIDLAGLDRFPTVAVARAVRARVLKRRQAIDAAWRRSIAREPSHPPDPASPEFRGDDPELAEIRRLCQPRDVFVRLVADR
jgi:lysophospholipase L1-like esterase